jgi:hypothetical protein
VWLQERHLAPPADEFRPHMLIFEASAGNEFRPRPLPPGGLQAAAKGSSWVGPKLIRPTSGDQALGPPFAHKWGHDLHTEPDVNSTVKRPRAITPGHRTATDVRPLPSTAPERRIFPILSALDWPWAARRSASYGAVRRPHERRIMSPALYTPPTSALTCRNTTVPTTAQLHLAADLPHSACGMPCLLSYTVRPGWGALVLRGTASGRGGGSYG